MNAGDRIRVILQERKMSQGELAERAGKSFHTVRNAIFNGNMKFDTFELYANALGFDVVLRDRVTGKIFD